MRMISILCLCALLFIMGCGFKPIQMRGGPRAGLTLSTYDRGDGNGTFTGTGGIAGLGMGTDFFGLLGLDMSYQYRSIVQSRVETAGKNIYKYDNLYFPLTFSLKGCMVPVVSPYLSFGLGLNVQLAGLHRYEYNSGTALETDLGGGNASAFAILGLGAEVKLAKLRIVPEFMSNIEAQDDTTKKRADYHISVGVYYAP